MIVRLHLIKAICILVAAALILAAPGLAQEDSTPAARYGSLPNVYLNGTPLPADMDIAVREGVVFIALSSDLELALDVDLEYDLLSPVTAITLSSADAFLDFSEGEILYTANGIDRELLAAPFTSNGYLYVPLAELFRQLGADVERTPNEIHIKKKDAMESLLSEIPESFLQRRVVKEEKEEAEQATSASEEMPQAQGLQFTYENTFEFENVAISGDESLSSYVAKTDYLHRFSVRTMGKVGDKYKLNGLLKTSSTTDRTLNGGEVSTFNISLDSAKNHFGLYDQSPKVSRYSLKSYQTRGVLYRRKLGQTFATFVWGKTPKKLRESPYNRYLRSFFLNRKSASGGIGFSFARIKDSGIAQATDRLDNRVFSLFASKKFDSVETTAEIARSDTKRFFSNDTDSLAKWFEAEYRSRTSTLTSSYERVGSDFISETTFFTPGRREFIALGNHRYSKQLTIGGGYKTVRLLGESTEYIPIQINLVPLRSRPKMKFKIQDNFEKARGPQGTRITDKRKFILSDRLGKAKVDITFERRKQKDAFAEWSFRTSRRYRYITPITKRTILILQNKEEYKAPSTKPRKRYYQAKLTFEPKEWTEMGMNVQRYYNNSPSDRWQVSGTYRKIDIFNDREFQFEVGLSNYREHNDVIFNFSYSFYR